MNMCINIRMFKTCLKVPGIFSQAQNLCSFCFLRLKFKYNVDCVNPERINLAGQIATFVFDKTGESQNCHKVYDSNLDYVAVHGYIGSTWHKSLQYMTMG